MSTGLNAAPLRELMAGEMGDSGLSVRAPGGAIDSCGRRRSDESDAIVPLRERRDARDDGREKSEPKRGDCGFTSNPARSYTERIGTPGANGGKA